VLIIMINNFIVRFLSVALVHCVLPSLRGIKMETVSRYFRQRCALLHMSTSTTVSHSRRQASLLPRRQMAHQAVVKCLIVADLRAARGVPLLV